MSDWSDEVEARLEQLARWVGISGQDRTDIRAALEEIERLHVEREAAVNGLALMVERAEAAEHQNVELIKALAAYEAQVNELEAKLAEAHNLLAVMHRDGGHHTAEVGFEQSCKDAAQARHDLVAEVERLHEFAKNLLKVHEWRDDATADAILDALRGGGE